jgi:hypothetical protein
VLLILRRILLSLLSLQPFPLSFCLSFFCIPSNLVDKAIGPKFVIKRSLRLIVEMPLPGNVTVLQTIRPASQLP